MIVKDGGKLIGSFGWEIGGNSVFSNFSLSFKKSVSFIPNFKHFSLKASIESTFIASSSTSL